MKHLGRGSHSIKVKLLVPIGYSFSAGRQRRTVEEKPWKYVTLPPGHLRVCEYKLEDVLEALGAAREADESDFRDNGVVDDFGGGGAVLVGKKGGCGVLG